MQYKENSLMPILDLFQNHDVLGATQISEQLGKSRAIVHKYLKELVIQGRLEKTGKGSHTKYKLYGNSVSQIITDVKMPKISQSFDSIKKLNDVFTKFSPTGKRLEGNNGFIEWCHERNFDIEKKSESYISISKHIQSLQNRCGLISGKDAFGKSFEKVSLDDVFFADEYIWKEFGRGKLAEVTFYGKQTQNKQLINESIDMILPKLQCFISEQNFSAIAITPWSIKRENQLLRFLKNKLLDSGLPFINIDKYYPNGITIPQKSLKTTKQRIENARKTILVDDKNIGEYERVFLIDDFVGSGSTLNETAAKLKAKGVKEVIGFAFVGSLDLKYDVINEI